MNRIFLPALLIFLLSASFRITNLDLMEFKTDEAVNLFLSLRPLLGYEFSPGGTVSSFGILNPPLFNYILFPIVAINSDPRFVTFFIGLINSASIAVFFLIVKRYYGLSIALISGILFALSPWAILYSRKIWMQDLLIPFFLVVFYSIHKLIIDKKSFYWLPYTLSSFILIQLHQASIIFIGILTLFLLRAVKINLKYSLMGFIIGFLPLIPYLFYQYNNACPDCQTFLEAKDRLSPIFSLELFLRPLQITNQGGFRFIMGDDTLIFAQAFPIAEILRKIFYLEYLLLPAGALLFIKKFKSFRFMAFAATALPLFYFILKVEPFTHYYIIVMPLLFLFLGVALSELIKSKNLILRNSTLFLLFLLILASLVFNYSFFKLLEQKGSLNGDYGQVFSLSKEEKNERIANLRDIRYEEAFLESFIPLNYTFGFEPLGKILYGETRKDDIPLLEEKLAKEAENQKVKHQLLSYHTPHKPTIETVDFFRKKSLDLPAYEPLYKEVHRYYTSSNFKKEHIYTNGGIRFFYPEHWKIQELDNQIIISEEDYGLIIYQDQTNQEGIFKIADLDLGSYKAGYFEEKESKDKDRENRIETLGDILKSIRPL